jgi:hypothetical protein
VRLAVVGSTNITDKQRGLASVIIDGFFFTYQPFSVVSGGAVGIDSLAKGRVIAWNRDHGHKGWAIDFDEFLPENHRWEPDGFKARNLKIAEDCTHLLCIRTQQSTTYGSGWTADRAEELGKTVWRVTI